MNYLYHLYMEWLSKYGIPELFGNITFYIIPFCVVAIMLLIVVLALVLIERKLLGWLTQRKGPNRVGFWGVLQTIADAFKLLIKENITPDRSDKFLFNLAPILVFIPVMTVLGIIPYSSEFTFVNTSTNVILYLILVAFPVLSIFLGGWASNNKYSLMGAARGVAQVLSYEVPMTFVVLSVVVLSSSMNMTGIIFAQYSRLGALGWFCFPCFIGFVILFICVLAELNRCPFDLPEAESELICGYNTEYSGMRFALFYLSEYALLFANSLFISILFLGGYLSPFGTYLSYLVFGDTLLASVLVYFEQVFWLLLKASLVIFVIIWIRATLPRLASFDLLKFSWAYLLPLSIFNLFLAVIIKYTTGGGICGLY